MFISILFTIPFTGILISVHLFTMTGENSLIAGDRDCTSIRCALFMSAQRNDITYYLTIHVRSIESQSSYNIHNNDGVLTIISLFLSILIMKIVISKSFKKFSIIIRDINSLVDIFFINLFWRRDS